MQKISIPHIEMDLEKCDQCGLCMQVCRAGVFETKEDGSHPIVTYPLECFFCGHCIAVCPQEAITHSGMNMDNFPYIEEQASFGAEELSHFLRTRRSVRIYNQKRPVSKSVIETLLEVARYAPTGSNAQRLEHIVVRDPQTIEKLSGLCIEAFRDKIRVYRDGKVLRSMDAAEAERARANYWVSHSVVRDADVGKDPIFYNAPVIVITYADPASSSTLVEDAAIAAYQMMIVAQSLGLGTCYIGFFYHFANESPQVRALLGIPEGNHILMTFTLGYPAVRFRRLVDRKAPVVRWLDP